MKTIGTLLRSSRLYGPVFKNYPTMQLELCVKDILNSKPFTSFINHENEFEIFVGNANFNITKLLKSNPSFDMFQFDDEDLNRYANFMNNQAQWVPETETRGKVIFTKEEYDELDRHDCYSNLHYGACLAVTHFTGQFFSDIQNFLRSDAVPNSSLVPENYLQWGHEIIMAICIASYAVSLPTPNGASSQSMPQPIGYEAIGSDVYPIFSDIDLNKRSRVLVDGVWVDECYRKEKVSGVDDAEYLIERENAIISGESVLHKGFTSMSTEPSKFWISNSQNTTNTIADEYEIKFHFKDVNFERSAKNISGLSMHPRESEVLVVPHTRFHYWDEKGSIIGGCIQNINVCNKFKRKDDIRHQLNLAIAQYRRILNYKNEIKDINKFTNQLEFLQSKVDMDCFDRLELIRIVNQLENQLVIRENSFAYMMLCNASMRFYSCLVNTKYLDSAILKHTNFVYKNYLSKPYEDSHVLPVDLDIVVNNFLVNRPNHGLSRALRIIVLLPRVISYFSNFAQNKVFKSFCANISSDRIDELLFASLFLTTGRESEISYFDDARRYMKYRYDSAMQFEERALNSNMDVERIKIYSKAIKNLGNKKYSQLRQEEFWFVLKIFEFAHDLDLRRCYSPIEYESAIKYFDQYVVSSSDQYSACCDLVSRSENALRYTGNRVFNKACNINYDDVLFHVSSTDPMMGLFLASMGAEIEPHLADGVLTHVKNILSKQNVRQVVDSEENVSNLESFCF